MPKSPDRYRPKENFYDSLEVTPEIAPEAPDTRGRKESICELQAGGDFYGFTLLRNLALTYVLDKRKNRHGHVDQTHFLMCKVGEEENANGWNNTFRKTFLDLVENLIRNREKIAEPFFEITRKGIRNLGYERLTFGKSPEDAPTEVGPKWEAKIKSLEASGLKRNRDFFCFASDVISQTPKDCKYEIFLKPQKR